MKDIFITKNSNVQRFLSHLTATQNRGAGEACLMVWDGQPGLGKTRTATWWTTQSGAVMLRAKHTWSPSRFYHELLDGLGVTERRRDLCGQAIQALAMYQMSLNEAGKTLSLVIDEADSLLNYPKGRLLEAVRDLTDTVEMVTVLVGMDRLLSGITRFPAVARRISQVVHFQPLTLDDVNALVEGLTDVEVKPDLIAYLHKSSRGYASEAKEGIAAIERFAKRNPNTPIGCAEMNGEVLMFNRLTGNAITVKEGA